MTPERSRQVSQLYHAALAREPSERSAFLEHACAGDEPLRREVESLLAYEEVAADFLEIPAGGNRVPDLQPSKEGMTGHQVGSYQILSLLGVGGMGEVYRARDAKLGRDVAIKFLPSAFTADPMRRARSRASRSKPTDQPF
jgi:eukaryotic-like serine/threonine-protein kinase